MEQRMGAGAGGAKHNNGNIAGKAHEITEQAEKQFEDLRERFGEVNERVMGFIRERPGTAIVIALGAGYLIGRMLRS